MRTTVVTFVALAGIELMSGCSPATVVADASTDAAADGASPLADSSLPDTSVLPDGSSTNDAGTTDARTNDAGLVCGALGGTYTDAQKTCRDASDCAMITRGCYCGAQPVLGVSKSSLGDAEACESAARRSCALGCPNAPGRVAEDGRNDLDGGTIVVLCDLGKCHTVLP